MDSGESEEAAIADVAVRLNAADGARHLDVQPYTGKRLKEPPTLIVRARWHDAIIDDLVDGAKAALKECGVPEENIVETDVPGAFELPLVVLEGGLRRLLDQNLVLRVRVRGLRDDREADALPVPIARQHHERVERDAFGLGPDLKILKLITINYYTTRR